MSDVITREIPFGRPIIGQEEKKAVADVLDGPILVHGPRSKQFEEDFTRFTGGGYSVSISSCTAGLHLSYFYKKIGSGNEVIVPAQSHTATVHAVEFVGAKPIFIDSERQTGNIDIDQIESAITDKTKAISVVHYLGMPVAMDRICALAQKYNLYVVEDCALAFGTYYKGIHAGLWGDTGSFSFYPVKHMTTAEGGMIITKHEDIAAKLQRQKAFGVDRTVGERKVPGEYDVNMLGYNYRLNEMQCALGIEQLKRLPGFLTKRKENYEVLEAGLKEVEEIELFQSSCSDFQSSYYCLSVILKDNLADKRYEMIQSLKSKGIGTSIYYPKPIPHFTYYKEKYGFSENDYPVASRISYQSIALPVGPHLDVDDMKYIVERFKESVKEIK